MHACMNSEVGEAQVINNEGDSRRRIGALAVRRAGSPVRAKSQ
jgi:hypothetical protein